MTQSIGSLVAELSANTASFQRDMGKAAAILNGRATEMNRSLAGIERGIGLVGKAFLGAISITMVARFAQGVLNMGEEFANLTDKTGVSVEKLSEFAYGVRQSDISMQDLSNGLRKLAVNMSEAATKGGGQMAATFRSLGISVVDANGNLRDTAQVFEELSRRFAESQDGPEKVALAVALLGRSGESLIPLMNDLSKTSAEARRLGLVMSTEAAKNSQAFNDEMDKLAQSLQYAVLPVITSVSRQLRSLFGSEDLDLLQERRAKAAREYSQLIEAGMSKNSARIVTLLQQIDALDAKIIEVNKRMLAEQAPAAGKPKPLPLVPDVGEIKRFESLLQDIQKATQQAQLSITTDEGIAAQQRMQISVDEFQFKIAQSNLAGDELKKVNEAFNQYIVVAAERMRKDARSPLERLTDDWNNTAKQTKDVTAKWANDTASILTNLVMTGKASFSDFARSIIADLVRIQIQKSLAGLFSGFDSLWGGGTQPAVAGKRAGGGPVSAGQSYLIGERGPELFVPNVSGMVVPNSNLSGASSVTVNNYFQVSTGVTETVRAEMMALAPVLEERSKQGVLAAIERGGRYSQAVGRKA